MKTIKLPGFTLVELIIVLLLSVLVTTTCFSLLSFASDSSNTFSDANRALLEVTSFAQAFEKELFLSTEINRVGEDEVKLSNSKFEISYLFSENEIRKNYLKPAQATIKFNLISQIEKFELDNDPVLKQATAFIEIGFPQQDNLILIFEK